MEQDFKARAKQLVSQMSLAEKMSQMLHNAPAIERLGVPAYNWWNECLHGVGRSGVATVFPQAIGLAASFDTARMYETATAISDEARAKYHAYQRYHDGGIYKGLTFWSPNINIFRDPRWGRGHETYGEDPVLTANMGVAFIRGLQGDDPTYHKLDATLKHYAVHSGPEADRHHFDARVSKKDLYETYLAAFKQCIDEAHPAAVMGAYNRVNGEACCASPTLLGEILREQFGFDGYILSDCGAIVDINRNHHITNTEAESAAYAVNCGCALNCGSAYASLMVAYEQGLVTEETITQEVERLFEARFRLGMFDEPEKVRYSQIPYDVIDCGRHRVLARKMAAAATVVLKNDGVLPLSREIKNIAVIGPNAHSHSVLLGNYEGTPSADVTILDGIREHAGDDTYVRYAEGCHLYETSISEWSEHPETEALIAADLADVIVFVGGLSPQLEGEESDEYNGILSGDKPNIELPGRQLELFGKLASRGKPTVFINVSGSAVALGEVDKLASAVVQVFYPGEEGGAGVADILFGDETPHGKLPVTFYRSDSDLPAFADYSMANRTYRYFAGEPVYPFAYGLSYTSYAYTDLKAPDSLPCGQDLDIEVTVSNTGDYSGQESVLVFAHVDSPDEVKNTKLVGFTTVQLNEKQQKRVSLHIAARRLAVISDAGEAVLPSGTLTIWVGGRQPDAVSARLKGDAVLSKQIALTGKEAILPF